MAELEAKVRRKCDDRYGERQVRVRIAEKKEEVHGGVERW